MFDSHHPDEIVALLVQDMHGVVVVVVDVAVVAVVEISEFANDEIVGAGFVVVVGVTVVVAGVVFVSIVAVVLGVVAATGAEYFFAIY